MATASLLRPSCGTLEACRRPSSAPATRVVLAIPSRQQPLSRQQRRQRAVVAQAGRGGGTGSGSDEEDYFGEQGSIDDGSEYYDSEDVEELADTSMRLYLDSADIKEWAKWVETGLFYGFTTNPTILRRDGVACNIASMRRLTREAFSLEVEELQLQAWGSTSQEMYSCGLDLMDLDGRIVVKLPITLEGAKAANRLIEDGVPVTMTGVYAAHQVVSSLAMGAAYCAPYVGRMTDAGKNGIQEAARMQKIVDLGCEGGHMRLLVASIRSADEVAALSVEGCNTFTLSPAVAAQLFNEPLTIAAAELFQEHADEMGAMRGH